jgi:hypothetical protein
MLPKYLKDSTFSSCFWSFIGFTGNVHLEILITFVFSTFRIAIVKAAFKKKRAIFTSKMDFEPRKKLVKCYTWSIALYGAET